MKEASFYIEQMSCQACSSGIERALSRKSFCESIQVHLLSKKAHIRYDETQVSLEDIFALIQKMGYEPHLNKDLPPKADISNASKSFSLNALMQSFDNAFLPPKRKLFISVCATLITLVLSWGEMFHFFHLPFEVSYFTMLFLSLIVAHMGRGFYIRGFKALLMKNPNMDSLIAIGTTSAFLYSLQGLFGVHSHAYFDSVCVIITLVLIGKTIENRSKKDALDSASLLLELNQKNVQRLCLDDASKQNASEGIHFSNTPSESIFAQDVKEGDILKVLPGEMIVVDCVVLEGKSSLDTSAINGESLPTLAQSGIEIFSGSMNMDSVLYVRAQKNAKQSTLAQILALVQQAQESKAPIASLADKIAGIFVPLVICLALAAGAFWWGMRDFEFGLSIFIATLVISCPCALGLATPMAILHAQSISNKMGVFFKDARSLQILGEITHIAFDKTGTLTQGLAIEQIQIFDNNRSEQEVFNLAYTLESTSHHIIAKAFLQHPLSQNATLLPVSESQNIIGQGIKAKINGTLYFLGNAMLLPQHLQESAQNKDDKITLYLATQERILAQFSLQDYLKNDALLALKYFKERGIEATLISGDNTNNTQKIAQMLGISDFYAQVLPSEKMRILQEKLSQHKVLMVGDGINDAPALALAFSSAAFASAYDIATQSADMIIYNPKVMSIYNAYALSQATILNIKQNLGFAFCYNIAFIPLAMGALGGFGIFLHPIFCALAMSLSSLSVVFNAARLKGFKIL
ncbi:MAG: cation-translocating P-type ATPase [Helicobacter sp.]|uniref:heavy metal translocating P-type ATPase n=1 Tax=Helicobacter sp. TaxID=218 RepID=UPI0025BDF744|nr:cation-translocating P-type ATPase [Helicobacter sp.]MCH5314195.1 cation-translocating P-type ATPase [Helicobacter sp.]